MKSYLSMFLPILLFILGIDASAAWKKITPVLPQTPRDSSTCGTTTTTSAISSSTALVQLRGGGWLPAGWNPFGYKITDLGEEFLKYDGCLNSDVGRFLASLRGNSGRKSRAALKQNWVEVVKNTKTGQPMRIWRQLDDLIAFCLKAGFIG